MTQEDKQLLLKDLCARLPYGVIVQVNDGLKGIYDRRLVQVFCDRLSCSVNVYNTLSECICIDSVKPYLRPMSSMTEDEKLMYEGLMIGTDNVPYMSDVIDWLNKKMFDFRGLIPKGRAIAVNENNNPYEKK